jgi:hypothetical protein
MQKYVGDCAGTPRVQNFAEKVEELEKVVTLLHQTVMLSHEHLLGPSVAECKPTSAISGGISGQLDRILSDTRDTLAVAQIVSASLQVNPQRAVTK